MATLVVGATGATGRLLVEQLLNRKQNVKISTYNKRITRKVVEPGFHCEMRIYPTSGLASVIMSNKTSFNSRKVLSELDMHFVVN